MYCSNLLDDDDSLLLVGRFAFVLFWHILIVSFLMPTISDYLAPRRFGLAVCMSILYTVGLGIKRKEKRKRQNKKEVHGTDGWMKMSEQRKQPAHYIHIHYHHQTLLILLVLVFIPAGIISILYYQTHSDTAQHRHPIYSRTCTFYFIHKSVKQESIFEYGEIMYD